MKKDILNGLTILFEARTKQEIEKLKKEGIFLKQTNDNFETIINYLVREDNIELVQYLLEKENFADALHYSDNEDKTPIFYVKSTKMLDLLMKFGADIQATDIQQRTVLHREFSDEEQDLLKALIKYEADVNAKDEVGNSPIFYQSSVGIAEILFENGADLLQLNNFGHTAKADFFKNHNKKMIKWFNSKVEDKKEEI